MVTYDKLRHLLIDRKIKLSVLCKTLNISRPTKSKLDNDEIVNLEILIRICKHLDVDIGDIVSIKKDQP